MPLCTDLTSQRIHAGSHHSVFDSKWLVSQLTCLCYHLFNLWELGWRQSVNQTPCGPCERDRDQIMWKLSCSLFTAIKGKVCLKVKIIYSLTNPYNFFVRQYSHIQWEKSSINILLNIIFCVPQKRNSYKVRTDMRVNKYKYFGWSIPLSVSTCTFAHCNRVFHRACNRVIQCLSWRCVCVPAEYGGGSVRAGVWRPALRWPLSPHLAAACSGGPFPYPLLHDRRWDALVAHEAATRKGFLAAVAVFSWNSSLVN